MTQEEIFKKDTNASKQILAASYPPTPSYPSCGGLRKNYEAHQPIPLWLPATSTTEDHQLPPSSPPPEVQNRDPTRRARSPRPHSSCATRGTGGFFVGRKNGVGSGGRLANGSKNLFVHLFQIVSWFSKDPKKIRAITSAWKLEESSRDLPKRLPHRYWYTVRVKPPQTISNLSDLPL